MRPRALTLEAIARIRAVEAARRAIPTRKQLAAELGVSKSLVDHIAAGHGYKVVPRETPTMLHENVVQME